MEAALEEARRAGKRQAAPFSRGRPKPSPKKRLLQDALELRDRWEVGELGEHGLSILRGKLEKRLARVLAMKVTHTGNGKFQAHMDNHADELLTFLYEDVEATNWPRDAPVVSQNETRLGTSPFASPKSLPE